MPRTTPDFEEVCLNSEVTAYVNTDQAPARSRPGAWWCSVSRDLASLAPSSKWGVDPSAWAAPKLESKVRNGPKLMPTRLYFHLLGLFGSC